jgi:hypothetical protein
MLEIFVGLGFKLLGWGGQLLKWLQTLPWYVLALAACVVVILLERHEWTSADATVATQAAQLVKDREDLATDAKSIKTLEGTVAAQNAAVDGYEAQSTAAQQAAALARAQAAQAARGRAAAIAELKAAQARPELNDCPAPTAHNDARGQL